MVRVEDTKRSATNFNLWTEEVEGASEDRWRRLFAKLLGNIEAAVAAALEQEI